MDPRGGDDVVASSPIEWRQGYIARKGWTGTNCVKLKDRCNAMLDLDG